MFDSVCDMSDLDPRRGIPSRFRELVSSSAKVAHVRASALHSSERPDRKEHIPRKSGSPVTFFVKVWGFPRLWDEQVGQFDDGKPHVSSGICGSGLLRKRPSRQ